MRRTKRKRSPAVSAARVILMLALMALSAAGGYVARGVLHPAGEAPGDDPPAGEARPVEIHAAGLPRRADVQPPRTSGAAPAALGKPASRAEAVAGSPPPDSPASRAPGGVESGAAGEGRLYGEVLSVELDNVILARQGGAVQRGALLHVFRETAFVGTLVASEMLTALMKDDRVFVCLPMPGKTTGVFREGDMAFAVRTEKGR